MAKQTGLGDNIYVAGFDLSDNVGSLGSVHGGPAALDVTPISKLAYTRLGGLRDGGISVTTFFDDAAGREHPALSTLPTTDVHIMYAHNVGGVQAIGGSAAGMVAKQVNYDGTRGNDGQFTFAVDAQSNAFGLEWGNLLTAGTRTDTTATNGTGLDTLASASFGAQAYLQVFSLTGTNAVIRVEDSADNVTFAAVTGLTFTSATGRTSERLATANNATIRRYLRVATPSGTFSSVTFAVMVVKNEAAGVVF